MMNHNLTDAEIESGRAAAVTEILKHPVEAPMLLLLGLEGDRMQVTALPVSDRDMANAITALICSFAYQQTTFGPVDFMSAITEMVFAGMQTGIAMRLERETNPTGVQH